jgi:hypothetical protein
MSLGFQKRSALKDLERIIPGAKRRGMYTLINYRFFFRFCLFAFFAACLRRTVPVINVASLQF